MNETKAIREQYRDGTNLEARIALHARFSTARQGFHQWLFEYIDVPHDARILELGCGTGQLWRTLGARVPRTWRLVLTDMSFGMVSSPDLSGLAPAGPSGLTQCDAQAIPFADESFDAVIANHMLYHVPDLPSALREIRRVLIGGGRLYAATNGAGHMHELDQFAVALGIDYRVPNLSFRLENGAELLAPYFQSVMRHDFADSLVVSEAQPLVAYILSMRSAMTGLSDEQLQRMRALVCKRIALEGAMRITKETGLFVARK